jgi:hypothetical protein
MGGSPVVVAVESRVFNCVTGSDWTPAVAGAGKTLLSVAASVLVFDAANFVTDSNAVTITALPIGDNLKWNSEDANALSAPAIISSGPTGRIQVVYSVR